jgi:hypothetical protein
MLEQDHRRAEMLFDEFEGRATAPYKTRRDIVDRIIEELKAGSVPGRPGPGPEHRGSRLGGVRGARGGQNLMEGLKGMDPEDPRR